MTASTEVEITRLRNKFENEEKEMRNRNDRFYWVAFSHWIVENYNLVSVMRMP